MRIGRWSKGLVGVAALAMIVTACDAEDEGTPETPEAAEAEEAPEDGPEDAESDLATVTWDGEPMIVTGTRCDTRSVTLTPNGYSVEAFFEDSGHYLWAIWDQDDDAPALVITSRNVDGDPVTYVARFYDGADAIDGSFEVTEGVGASGSVHLEADSNLAEEELPEGGRMEFDISCP